MCKKLIFSLVLMFALVSIGYSDCPTDCTNCEVIGDWENSNMDNWVPGWEGDPCLTPGHSPEGVTLHDGSLKVTWTDKYWILQYNSPNPQVLPPGSCLMWDMTAYGADLDEGVWCKMADKVALNGDGGWVEYTNTTAVNRDTCASEGLDWGSWSTVVERTYTTVFEDGYDPGGWMQILISLQLSPEGEGHYGTVYLDNARLCIVPEPTTIVLLSLGGLSLLRVRKRR